MDYSQEYFTIESLESGNTITLTIGSNVSTSELSYIGYTYLSGPGSGVWNQLNNKDNEEVSITFNLDANQGIKFRGSGTNLANNYETNGAQYRTTFSSTKNYKVSGNIMSLLYYNNFYDKTEVTANYAFCGLFYQSSKLVDAQNLVIPIKNVNKLRTFVGTFRECTSLVNSPQFAPESITQQHGCMRMFYSCTSLVSTNDLSHLTSITGASACLEMFRGCSSLNKVSELPATILYEYCYYSMFKQCTSLVKAPVLPANTLANNCYNGMFYGCTNLQKVTCLATDISAKDCLSNWLYGVAASGTFYKNPNTSSFPSGASGIPSGWTTEAANTFTYNGHYPDNITLNGTSLSYLKVNGSQVWRRYYYTDYFTIESLEASNTITLTIGSGISTERLAWVAWSKDKTNWTTVNNVNNQAVTITVNADIEKVYFKGSGTRFNVGGTVDNTSRFSTTKKFNVSGNCASLWLEDNFIGVTETSQSHIFRNTFYNCTKLISAKNLILPFITFGNSAYNNLFAGCTSLVDTPELPATTMTDSCYAGMFNGCTSLTKSPVLPAKTLNSSCYKQMFNGCTNLQEVTCLATDISATNCLTDWLNNVKATGTFYKDSSMTSFPSGASGIPSGWTTENYVA